MVTFKGITTIVGTLFGSNHTSSTGSRGVSRAQSDPLPEIFLDPILSREFPHDAPDVMLSDLVDSLVSETRLVSHYAGAEVGSVLLKSMATVKHSLHESFYSASILSGAVHFAELAIACASTTQAHALNEISQELADDILTSSHLTASKIFNKMLDQYRDHFRRIFGSHNEGIESFRAVIVVAQLESIPLPVRKRVIMAFTEFLQQSVSAIKTGSFEGASHVFELRDSLLRPLLSLVHSVLALPSKCDADAQVTKRMKGSL